MQTSFALMTATGRAKEAAALAGAGSIEITHIAIGDGATVPSGGETQLYHEVDRKTIAAHGTVVGAANVAYFDAFLAAADGPYTIREAGLIDVEGDLIAIAHYNPPLNKPVPASGQTVEGTLRLEVAFSDIAHVTIVIDPAMQVPLQRLTRLPWVPVVSMTVTAPPGEPAPGDIYLIPAGATGAWAGHAGKLAEWFGGAWTITTPPNGHGISLPDGRIFERIAGTYVEFVATRQWVEARKTPLGQFLSLPWLPVVSMTTTAPPGAPAAGDTYLIPAGATGAWAGHAGKLAEWSGVAWTLTTPPNGHGVGLPDGRIFQRIAGTYVEFVASRAWVETRMTPVAQLLSLPWLPVISTTTTAPPGAPAAGDAYLVPAGATGAWAGHAGKLAEWSGSAWALTTPPNGHGISLPDGRIFERIAGTYVEKIAADVQTGKWNYAAAAGTANAMTATLTPAPASLAVMTGAPVRIKKGAAANTAAVTLNLNGLGVKPVVQVDGSALAAGALPANSIFEVVYDGTNFQLVSATAAAPTIFAPAPTAPTAVIDLQETEGLFEAMAGHIASTSGGTVQCGVDISFDNGSTWVALYQDNNVSPGENALLIISVKGGTYRALMMQTNSTGVQRGAGNTGTVTNLRLRVRAASGNVTYSEFWIRKAG